MVMCVYRRLWMHCFGYVDVSGCIQIKSFPLVCEAVSWSRPVSVYASMRVCVCVYVCACVHVRWCMLEIVCVCVCVSVTVCPPCVLCPVWLRSASGSAVGPSGCGAAGFKQREMPGKGHHDGVGKTMTRPVPSTSTEQDTHTHTHTHTHML